MPGQPLRIGPFLGGLNLGSDPTAIADAELTDLVNMELDIDGSLVSRPPFTEIDGPPFTASNVTLLCEGIFGGNHYLIGSNSSGTFYYFGDVWTSISTTLTASAAVQYSDNIYLIAPSNTTQTGGKWNPTGGFTAVAAIPRGQSAVVHKSRLFLSRGVNATTNQTRLQFSDADNFDSWPGTNFIDIAQGDGQILLDLVVYQDNLLVFKNDTTYVLAYDIRPTDAVLRKISNTIGLDGQNCIVNYENQIFILHNGWVYEIVNYDFNRLNTKVPFVFDQSLPVDSAFDGIQSSGLSVLADRVLIRYYARLYVYNLRTRTFSEWTASDDRLKYSGVVITMHKDTGDEYYAGACITTQATVLQLFNDSTISTFEQVATPNPTTIDTFTRTVSNGWGSADTGDTYTVVTGSASDFSVNGSEGITSVGSLNASSDIMVSRSLQNFDALTSITCPVVVTGSGGWVTAGIIGRRIDANNFYLARMEFKDTGVVGIALYKIIAGSSSPVGAGIELGSFTQGQKWNLRFSINGSTLKLKAWNAATSEPGGFRLIATDSSISAAGNLAFRGLIFTGNTNALPIAIQWDNINIGDKADNKKDIACRIITKNFDMAVPNQFKRMWWWGADISTDRTVKGTATPIIVSFTTTWDMMALKTWDDFFTWDQPLTEPTGVATTVNAGTGTSRRFLKFLKGLRYRQIKFQVDLLTNGSTSDGPAKLFTLTVITETKESVVKQVS